MKKHMPTISFSKANQFVGIRVMLMLAAVVGFSSIFMAQTAAQNSTVSKSCGSCKKPVAITSKVGDVCPHCHVRWGYENSTRIPETQGGVSPAPTPTASELYAKKMANVWKTSDQSQLEKLALEDIDPDTRRAAAGQSTDQKLLRRMAEEAKDVDVRVIAVWKLNDKTVLANVAKNDANASVRQAATHKLAVETETIDLGGGVKMELVLVRPGSFMMGSDMADDEKPVHKVTLTKPFYLGKFEVTQEQWQAVMGSNPSQFKGPKLPVENVNWNDCQAFLTKLQEKTGRKFALPTEAQWEYACRAGTTTRYSFGDSDASLAEHGWSGNNSGNTTHPVGEKKPNPWGFYDLHGNVWEWCADWFANSYPRGDATDPQGASSGNYRVLRGGAWGYGSGALRSSYRSGTPGGRYYYAPDVRNNDVGLRCVMLAGEASP